MKQVEDGLSPGYIVLIIIICVLFILFVVWIWKIYKEKGKLKVGQDVFGYVGGIPMG